MFSNLNFPFNTSTLRNLSDGPPVRPPTIYNTGTEYRLLTTILTDHLHLGIEVACMLQCTAGDAGPATVSLIS